MALDPEELRKQEGQPGSESTETEGPSLDEKLEELPDDALESLVEEAADRTEEALVEVPGDAREQAVGRLEPATQPAAATIRERFRNRAKSLKLALVFSLGLQREPDITRIKTAEPQPAGADEGAGNAKVSPAEPTAQPQGFNQLEEDWFARRTERPVNRSEFDYPEPLSPEAQRLMAQAEQQPDVNLDAEPEDTAEVEQVEQNPEAEAVLQEQMQLLQKIRNIALQIGMYELTPVLINTEHTNQRALLKEYNTLRVVETPDNITEEDEKKIDYSQPTLVSDVVFERMEARLMNKLGSAKNRTEKKAAKPNVAEAAFQQKQRDYATTVSGAFSRTAEFSGKALDVVLEAGLFTVPALAITAPEKIVRYAWTASGRVLGDTLDFIRGDERTGKRIDEDTQVLQVANIGDRLKLIKELREAEVELATLRDQYNGAKHSTQPDKLAASQARLESRAHLTLLNPEDHAARDRMKTELTQQRVFRRVMDQLLSKNPELAAAVLQDPTAIDQLVQLSGEGAVELKGILADSVAKAGITVDTAILGQEAKFTNYLVEHERAMREAAKLYLLSVKRPGEPHDVMKYRQQQIHDGAFTMDIDNQGRWIVKLALPSMDPDFEYMMVKPEFSKAVFTAIDRGQIDPNSKEINPELLSKTIEAEAGAELPTEQKPLVDLSKDVITVEAKLTEIIDIQKNFRKLTPDEIRRRASGLQGEQAELVETLKNLQRNAGDDATLQMELGKYIQVAEQTASTLAALKDADDEMPRLLGELDRGVTNMLNGLAEMNKLLNGVSDQKATALLQKYASEMAGQAPVKSKFAINDKIKLKHIFPGRPVEFKVVVAEQNYYRLEYTKPLMEYTGTMVLDEATLVKYMVGNVEPGQTQPKPPIDPDIRPANRTPDQTAAAVPTPDQPAATNKAPDQTAANTNPDTTTAPDTTAQVATPEAAQPVVDASNPTTNTAETTAGATEQPTVEAQPTQPLSREQKLQLGGEFEHNPDFQKIKVQEDVAFIQEALRGGKTDSLNGYVDSDGNIKDPDGKLIRNIATLDGRIPNETININGFILGSDSSPTIHVEWLIPNTEVENQTLRAVDVFSVNNAEGRARARAINGSAESPAQAAQSSEPVDILAGTDTTAEAKNENAA